MNRAILIQGPSNNVSELKKVWDGYDIIWSTWVGEESKFDENDKVIFSPTPDSSGVGNIALQYKTTFEGLKFIKDLGYDRVLKWRSDMVPTSPNELLELFQHKCLNFLYWVDLNGGYIVDYMLEGDIDLALECWDINTFSANYSERITTDNILSIDNISLNFIGHQLTLSNDIYWIKRDVNISSYNNIKGFKNKI